MSPEQHQDTTYTYRGRSLEELVPRIRQELGDDAVIVSRRETSSGGVGGFFAKREIEVEVRPGAAFVPPQMPEEPGVAAAFAQQLADAQERARPATSPEIDALPGSADVTVDDLFPTPPPAASQNLAALFNAGMAPAEPEPEPESEREPEVLDDDEWEEIYGDEEDDDEDVAPEEPVAEEQPTGMFDYLGVAPEPIAEEPAAAWEPPVAEPTPEPVAAEPEPEPIPLAEPVAAVISPAPVPVAGLPPAAIVAAERLVARGLRQGLAEAIADEAIAGLAPLLPGSDPKDLVTDALARRIPMHPLRRGPGVVGFVGPGGAGKTRCVARLAAAHARHGVLAVTVVALRSPDGGAELRRLLAPYGVALHAIESGAEGAGLLAELRSTGLVIVDTPGVSPRSTGELRALGTELDSLAPDELHLAVPATIGPAAAQELVSGVRELGVGALVLTHTDETEMLGTVVGLAIDSGLPLSYLARGQAVEAGLKPANATELREGPRAMSRLMPSVGDELLLSVPQTEQVLVRVTADGPGFYDLALIEQPSTPQPILERSALTIEFINDDGVARMHGRLDVPRHRRGHGRGYGAGFASKETVRFAHRGSPQLLRRREYVRATVDLALTLTPVGADADGVTTHAHAIDLSGGGMLVKGLHCPHPGETLQFSLDLGDGSVPVTGLGRVVRMETSDRVGLQFTEIAEPACIRMQHLAFEMSREQRRRIA